MNSKEKEATILHIKEHLRSEARKKFPDNKQRQDAYVWGTINRIKERIHA